MWVYYGIVGLLQEEVYLGSGRPSCCLGSKGELWDSNMGVWFLFVWKIWGVGVNRSI